MGKADHLLPGWCPSPITELGTSSIQSLIPKEEERVMGILWDLQFRFFKSQFSRPP